MQVPPGWTGGGGGEKKGRGGERKGVADACRWVRSSQWGRFYLTCFSPCLTQCYFIRRPLGTIQASSLIASKQIGCSVQRCACMCVGGRDALCQWRRKTASSRPQSLLGFTNQCAAKRKMPLLLVSASVSLAGACWYQVLISSGTAGVGGGRETERDWALALPLCCFLFCPKGWRHRKDWGCPWQRGLDRASAAVGFPSHETHSQALSGEEKEGERVNYFFWVYTALLSGARVFHTLREGDSHHHRIFHLRYTLAFSLHF